MSSRLTIRTLLALAGVGVASLMMFDAGCGGSSCESICSQRNTCTAVKQINCSQYCAAAVALNTSAGCGGHYTDTLACYDSVKDVCTDTSCNGQVTSLAVCYGTYCLAHANDANCQALNQSASSGG
jgi:hypothetical protein